MQLSTERVIRPVTSWWASLSPVLSDATLYFVAGVFALLLGLTSSEPAQWHWGYISFTGYFLASLVLLIASRWSTTFSLRKIVLVGLVVGVILIPLGLETHWRQNNGGHGYAQPEVSVIERSAKNVVKGTDPYIVDVKHGKVMNSIRGLPTYESFFPYFPLMSIFGLPDAITHRFYGLTDARIVMSLLTIAVGLVALRLFRAKREQKLRLAQVLFALPTGALFLATGGDDMPILALMLLGVVALQRKQIYVSAVSIGIASAMKLTAWPMALGALLTIRSKEFKGSLKQFAGVVGLILVATILPFAIKAPHAFFANVFAFPLGLTSVTSPAASALPGHILSTWWHPFKHIVPAGALIIGGYFTASYLKQHWPITLSKMLSLIGTCFVVLMSVSSATRFGYIIYPINFYLWSWASKEQPALSI